jgi:uncharacterized membrane protein YciS (DUF1049 family)
MKILHKVKDKIIGSSFIRVCYKSRFYLNMGIRQVSWFTGKLPEIMAFIFITEWLGFKLSQTMLIVFCVGVVFGLTVMGYIWKHSGLFDIEVYVDTTKNPVQNEIYQAALLINKNIDNFKVNIKNKEK